jgi:hypothetical protein
MRAIASAITAPDVSTATPKMTMMAITASDLPRLVSPALSVPQTADANAADPGVG